MHIDLNKAPTDLALHSDVAIIGAGAAGITAARRLIAQGHRVLLLESGGTDHAAWSADLNVGRNVGEDYYELDHARLRFFGGTTAIWGGRCAELDPIDLERRPWVAHSGWPISYADLRRYYDEAWGLFDLGGERPGFEDLAAHGVHFPDFDGDLINGRLWSFDSKFSRFQYASCDDLRVEPRCTIVTHATVSEIVPDRGGNAVNCVTAIAPGGRRLMVYPRAVLLAAGGLENPRLLLSSNLGNQHDQVGRYFMEHPHARGGRIVTHRPWALLKAFGRPHMVDGRKVAALIAPSERLQAEEEILNSSLTIVGRQPEQARQSWGMRAYGRIKHDAAPTKLGRTAWMHAKKTVGWLQRQVDPFRPWALHKLGQLDLTMLVRAEQAPNPLSRVTLSNERDAFGMRRLQLDWRFVDQDKRSVERLVWAVDYELRRLGLGHAEPADWLFDRAQAWRTDPLVSSHPIGGYHHMGTTRMSDDPRHGVTDADGRVHGLANLYVAGSSLFPTSGWANPTLTIAALALRTADRLSAALNRPMIVGGSRDAVELPPARSRVA